MQFELHTGSSYGQATGGNSAALASLKLATAADAKRNCRRSVVGVTSSRRQPVATSRLPVVRLSVYGGV